MVEQINFTTGPVKIEQDIVSVFNSTPISHRSIEFRDVLKNVRKKLCLYTKANDVIIMSGSGTLANEAMIAQIAQSEKSGLVLSNGEFGERLAKQCTRYRINFSMLRKGWGEHFMTDEILDAIQKENPQWILLCHHETSSGVLNNLPLITEICSGYNIPVYVDCISSVGNIDVNLSGVALASCSSGKGIASFPGLAMVFANIPLHQSSSIPTYLDLAGYVQSDYLPFTLNSNLLFALNKAIDTTMNSEHWKENERLSNYLKLQINNSGYQILNNKEESPAFVFSIILQNENSLLLGESLKKEGVLVSYESNYLKRKNMIQIALMGMHNEVEINYCIEKLMTVQKEIVW